MVLGQLDRILWGKCILTPLMASCGCCKKLPETFFFIINFIFFSFTLLTLFIFSFLWVLSYIDMNQPWSYMYSPSWSPLPPPSPPNSSGSSQCTRPEHLSHASHLGWWSVSFYIIYMLFSRNIPPSPSPTESKSLFCTSVSLFLFCI